MNLQVNAAPPFAQHPLERINPVVGHWVLFCIPTAKQPTDRKVKKGRRCNVRWKLVNS